MLNSREETETFVESQNSVEEENKENRKRKQKNNVKTHRQKWTRAAENKEMKVTCMYIVCIKIIKLCMYSM